MVALSGIVATASAADTGVMVLALMEAVLLFEEFFIELFWNKVSSLYSQLVAG